MAVFIGRIIGEATMLFVVFAIVLAIGKIGALRKHPLAVHVSGVALAWLFAIAVAPSSAGPAGAYLVTLAAIWSYRRETAGAPSGWYRIGAGLSAAWIALWLLILSAFRDSTDAEAALVAAWVFAVLGLLIWGIGWLVQWIRAGFKDKGASASGT